MAYTKEVELDRIEYNTLGEIKVYENWTYDDDDGDVKTTTHRRFVVPGEIIDGTYTATTLGSGENDVVKKLAELWTQDLHDDYESHLNGQA